jgi:hypothetical protein
MSVVDGLRELLAQRLAERGPTIDYVSNGAEVADLTGS